MKLLYYKLKYYWHKFNREHSVFVLFRVSKKTRLFIRNHNGHNFGSQFILKIGSEQQGFDFKTYQIGILNFALCLGVSKEKN